MTEQIEAQNEEAVSGATPRALPVFEELPAETGVDKVWLMDFFGCAERTRERAVQDGKVRACSYGWRAR